MAAGKIGSSPWLRWALPFLEWAPGYRASGAWHSDAQAAVLSAGIMLPQAVVLARLTGLPAQYGIYAAFLPVIVAALWGSSRQLLSGPNTALCLLLATTVSSFAAPGSGEYIRYVSTLTLMVGAGQWLLGAFGLGSILDYLPASADLGITTVVGVTIMLSQTSYLLGQTPTYGVPAWESAYSAVAAGSARIPDLAVAAATVGIGLLAQRARISWIRRLSLLIALLGGAALSLALDAIFGSASMSFLVVGRLPVVWPALSMPDFGPRMLATIPAMLPGILTIAYLGLVQSTVIARTLADETGQRLDLGQEIRAQGLANITAAFASGFAGSGSFNRSRAHARAGARTQMAAVMSAVVMMLAATLGSRFLEEIPDPAMAGVLVLVGMGLINVRRLGAQWRIGPGQAGLVAAVVVAGVLGGLQDAVIVGVLAPLAGYLSKASRPSIRVERTQDGICVHLDGNVFFASAQRVAAVLRKLGEESGFNGRVDVDLRDVGYIDTDGLAMLGREQARWQERGGTLVLSGRTEQP
ncbi:MAG: SulP family inorganic anion transporter [Acidiferrobacterales bacterium]